MIWVKKTFIPSNDDDFITWLCSAQTTWSAISPHSRRAGSYQPTKWAEPSKLLDSIFYIPKYIYLKEKIKQKPASLFLIWNRSRQSLLKKIQQRIVCFGFHVPESRWFSPLSVWLGKDILWLPKSSQCSGCVHSRPTIEAPSIRTDGLCDGEWSGEADQSRLHRLLSRSVLPLCIFTQSRLSLTWGQTGQAHQSPGVFIGTPPLWL